MNLYQVALDTPQALQRVFNDEDDEDISESVFTPLFLRGAAGRERLTLKHPTAIVAVGHTACAFTASHYVARKGVLGTILLPGQSMRGQAVLRPDPRNSTCILYELETGDILVECQYDVSADIAVSWAMCFFENISATRFILLSSLLDRTFQAATGGAGGLRTLATSAANEDELLKEQSRAHLLETPHVVDNASAALLTHCQVHNYPAVLHVLLHNREDWEEEVAPSLYKNALQGSCKEDSLDVSSSSEGSTSSLNNNLAALYL